MLDIKNICPPALIFIIFSFVQIVFDLLRGSFNAAFFKGVLLIMVGTLLQLLCQQGLSIISWVIIFVPFIFLSTIVAILLYTFGLNPSSGTLNTIYEPANNDKDQEDQEDQEDKIVISQGNIIHV
ncbi:hypothetical protein N9K75_00775 [bacterium]|nr:hypothetical protein [bacterium]